MNIDILRTNAPKTRLYVEVMSENKDRPGEKRPVAFVLPGGPGTEHSAYLKYACLNRQVDLIFHDPRGCGKSTKGDPAGYTMDNYIDDVEAIRQKLSLNKIIVIGKSYGSMCALGYTLRYPHAVEKLVLAAGAPSYRFLETAKKNIQRIGSPEQIKVCEKLWKGGFKNRDELLHYFQVTNPLYSVKARKSPNLFDLTQKSHQFSLDVLNQGFRHAFWHFNYENDLQRVICPTLILAGREDWINDVMHAEFMVARISHSQLRIFEDASHAMESDVTDEYFRTIADFIT